MTIGLIAFLFILLVAVGMPISFAIGVAAMFGTLVLPDVDNATIVQRILTSATMGPIIPPSIGMIVFAHVAGSVSIAALFLAGVVPGILIGLSLMVAAFVHGRVYHETVSERLTAREKIHRVLDGLAGIM